MEKDNKNLEGNFLSRWSKKKSKQKPDQAHSKIDNESIKKSLDNKSSISTNEESKENDNLNDDELLKKYNLGFFDYEENKFSQALLKYYNSAIVELPDEIFEYNKRIFKQD